MKKATFIIRAVNLGNGTVRLIRPKKTVKVIPMVQSKINFLTVC